MPSAQFNTAIFGLILAIFIAVPCLDSSARTVQEFISTTRFHRDNTGSPEIIAAISGTLPYICLAFGFLLPSVACVHLYREIQRYKRSQSYREGWFHDQLAEAEDKATNLLAGQNSYRELYKTCLQDYENLQNQIAEARCPHGKISVGPDGFVTHTCCNEVGRLRRILVIRETVLANEIRFRKAPVDVGTIGDIMNDMAKHPRRWQPVLEKKLPSLMAHTRAISLDQQKKIRSLTATVQTLRRENAGLYNTMHQDAKVRWEMHPESNGLRTLIKKNTATIMSLRHDLRNKTAIIEDLEATVKASAATIEPQESRAEQIACTHCPTLEHQLRDSKTLVRSMSEQIETLTTHKNLRSGASKKEKLSEPKLEELKIRLQESEKKVKDLEKDVESQKKTCCNQSADSDKRKEKYKEEIARLSKAKGDLVNDTKSTDERVTSLEKSQIRESGAASIQEEAGKQDGRINELTQRISQLETAQQSAANSVEHYRGIVSQAEQKARTLLQPDLTASFSLVQLIEEIGSRVALLTAEFAPLEENVPFQIRVRQAVRGRFNELQGQLDRLNQNGSPYILRSLAEQEVSNRDDQIQELQKQLRDAAEAANSSNCGQDLSTAQAKIAELGGQNNEATQALLNAIAQNDEKDNAIGQMKQIITVFETSERNFHCDQLTKDTKIARLQGDIDCIADSLNRNAVGTLDDPLYVRVKCLIATRDEMKRSNVDFLKTWNYLQAADMLVTNQEGRYELLASVRRMRDEVARTIGFLNHWKLNETDDKDNPIRGLFSRVHALVLTVAAAQREIEIVFGPDASNDPRKFNIAARVMKLRQNRDQAVMCYNDFKAAHDKVSRLLDERGIEDVNTLEARVRRALNTREDFKRGADDAKSIQYQLQRVFGFAKAGSAEDHVVTRVTKLVDEKLARRATKQETKEAGQTYSSRKRRADDGLAGPSKRPARDGDE